MVLVSLENIEFITCGIWSLMINSIFLLVITITTREILNTFWQSLRIHSILKSDNKSNCRCGQVHDKLTDSWGDVIGPSGNFSKLKQYSCSTTPCERDSEYPDTINCKNGTVKNVTEHCGVNECPTARVVSSSAISINKGKFQCYENRQADF